MSRRLSANRSARSSGRYFPYLAPPSGQNCSSSYANEAASDPSMAYLHPASASAQHNHLHSSHPSQTSQPIYAEQTYTSSRHELEPFTASGSNPRPEVSHPTHPAPTLHVAPSAIAFCQSEGSADGYHSTDQERLQIPQEGTSPLLSVRYQSQGMFTGSHHLLFSGNTFIDNSITSDHFMEKLLQHTIIGAEYDSSDRHPPPRCHPGTQLAIVERCKTFIVKCDGNEKMRWVVGAAGVGKSAIMQMVAEGTPADASVFLSVNGRREGTKTFMTIAYQLAAKYEPYQQFIRSEIHRDPTLLRKSLPVQFRKFITEPFIHWCLFHPSHRFLVIIDGLDECDNPLTQVELLELILEFCITYPISPIAWFVASRPEPHICSFFDNATVAPAYTKEEITVDLDEACEDVQNYLRDELNRIKRAYPTLRQKREWPSELEFTKMATAAGGLFAYASTVVRYISDPHHRSPVARLGHVIATSGTILRDYASGNDHPMAQLDALYKRILSNVPAGVMINTRKLLFMNSRYDWQYEKFRFQCNLLELSEDAAYAAVSHLRAVVKVPTPAKADDERLEYFHKSFPDFLCDFNRSGFCQRFQEEAGQLRVQSVLRVLNKVPGDFNGYHGFCDDISLSWPNDECSLLDDGQLRMDMCIFSADAVCASFGFREFHSASIFHLLTTRFTVPPALFPFNELLLSVFGDLRAELTELGELKQVPLRTLDYAAICRKIRVWFKSPVETESQFPDRFNQSCGHPRLENDGLPLPLSWKTMFFRSFDNPGNDIGHTDLPRFNIRAGERFHYDFVYLYADDSEPDIRHEYACVYCFRRLACHFIDNPDQLATVFVDSTEMCYVELSFVDPEDGVSMWKYQFWHSGRPSYID